MSFQISSMIDAFLALRVALTIGKHDFAIDTIHVAFVTTRVACKILHSDNQGVRSRFG